MALAFVVLAQDGDGNGNGNGGSRDPVTGLGATRKYGLLLTLGRFFIHLPSAADYGAIF